MESKFKTWMSKKKIPGAAACIAAGNDIVWNRGFGLANIREKVPFSADQSLFQIASITKTITATATMQLRDCGHFEIDDDINEYLQFPIRNPHHPDEPITFQHLLMHTSSLKDSGFFHPPYTIGDPSVGLKDIVTQIFYPNTNLLGPAGFYKSVPGKIKRYSNAGFALLGYLIEAISGKSLESYLQQKIFEPLEMMETSFYIERLDSRRLVRPYTYANRSLKKLCPGDGDGNLLPHGKKPVVGYNEHALYSYPTLADGMLRTSVNQLAHFMIAMMNYGQFRGNQLLKPQTIAEMIPKSSDGLCWLKIGNYWGHDGRDPGCSTELMFDAGNKIGFIIFANADVGLKKGSRLIRKKAEAQTGS
ncbi:MAG: serine hydrolase domain-containing protein [Hyphomicrobiaceae bacterium]